MEIQETGLRDCVIIKPRVFEDSRGYFFESFNKKTFEEKTGISGAFVQDNQSFSTYGVIRGLHAQAGEFAQAKLVRVLKGEVLD
ncbi:MAG: dTDP-4-keto-6-deoxy-D-glucose epimerase, partial [Flavobacterium sp.]